MRAAIYARVSTKDQSCEIQLSELRGYVERMGWEAVEYVDEGYSGKSRSRPALDRLMRDAGQRKFDVVVVLKLDRFGRSLPHFVENVQALDSMGIRFIATSQGVDTDQKSPTSRLLMNMMAAFAQFERELIVERVSAGMNHAKASGVVIGRPRRVFRRDEVVRLRDEGKSWRAIGKELGIGAMTALETYREVKGA